MTLIERTSESGFSPVNLQNELLPSPFEMVARARSDLRLGLPVGLSSSAGSCLVLAVETLTKARFIAATQNTDGVLLISSQRAAALGQETDGRGLGLEINGLSYDETLTVADPSRVATLPKLKHVAVDPDFSEAALALVKSAQLLPAVVMLPADDAHQPMSFSNLTMLSTTEVLSASKRMPLYALVSHARVPTTASAEGGVQVYRADDGTEHYLLEVGTPDVAKPLLTRIHSACFTGDVLGSLKCDCGPQLSASIRHMADNGGGIVLYLNQEGRGIGLANKMRAYALQARGLDTVEANHHLGFQDDERDFRIAAEMLQRRGVSKIRLMTNNPAKLSVLEKSGIEILERVPLRVGSSQHNVSYLETKAKKSGHLL